MKKIIILGLTIIVVMACILSYETITVATGSSDYPSIQPVPDVGRPTLNSFAVPEHLVTYGSVPNAYTRPALTYAPNEIIVKFNKPIADIIEDGILAGKPLRDLKLSDSLDELHQKYRLRDAKTLFKNFKKNTQQMKALQNKDKAFLTKKERHILKRLARAPKDANVPDLSRIYKIQLELESGYSPEEAVAAYNNDPQVEYAQLNHIVSINLTPNDPLYSQQWALPKIDAPVAWDISIGSSEVIVAVLDTGVDYNHRDLDNNMWVNEAELNGTPGVDDDGNGYVDDIYGYDFCTHGGETRDSDPIDDHGHGTHCSGIIAAEGNNGLDISGVCWNTKIMALKFIAASGSGKVSDAAAAIYYAVDNGADVLSNSYGGDEYFQPLKDAIDYAYSQGVMIVAAAGNDDSDDPDIYPANYEHVISVAATDSGDEKASFSNYGDWIDISAPGVDILSLRASGTSMGDPYDNYTTKESGTSMACPYVAGVAALIMSNYPEASIDDITIRLLGSTDDISAQNPSYTSLLGSGRLNAYKALLSFFDGVVHLDRDIYSCDDIVSIKLRDADLAGQGTQQVILTSDGGDEETVTLIRDVSRPWNFTNSISTSADLVSVEDGLLQISHGQIITASYYDSVDSSGNPATVYATAATDCQGPMVLDVELVCVFSRRARVRFETDEPTTAIIRGGLTCSEPYSITGEDHELSTSHTIELIGLESKTEYYFVIEAIDALGNATTEDNGGACYSFTTTLISPPIVNVVNILNTRAEVKFETDEPTTAVLRGGLVCDGPYTITVNSMSLVTNHTFYLEGLAGNTNYYFVIEAVDDFGHEMVADNNGLCYSFKTESALPPLHVPGEYPTIQAAIDAANTYDTVVVADGIYTGDGNRDIDFKGKAITVKSANGPQNCIIDCQGTEAEPHRGFYFHSAEDRYSVLNGFTIKNGHGTFTPHFGTDAGGIVCTWAYMYGPGCSPTITNCIITGNSGKYAAGIQCFIKCSPIISNCIISENHAFGAPGQNNGEGAGIKSNCGGPTISNCIISGNIADRGAGILLVGNWPDVDERPTITNCTIINNAATVHGGGIWVHNYWSATITNCIFWGNEALWWGPSFAQIYVTSGPGACVVDVTYCNVQDGYNEYMGVTLWENNIETDPLFADSGNGDYRLQLVSPCVDAGTNSPVGELHRTDLDGKPRMLDGDGDGNSIVDIGAYEFTTFPYIAGTPRVFWFFCLEGGENPEPQILSIRNIGANVLNWQIMEDCEWLQAYPNNGSSAGESNKVTLSADIAGLTRGDYSCKLTISDPCATNSPQTAVEVILHVIGPIIQLSELEFDFLAKEDRPNPDDQILAISNIGGGTLNWQIDETCSWLSVSPDSGSLTGEVDDVTLSVDITGLTHGDYNCELIISDPCATNSPQTVELTLHVIGPIIELSASEFVFFAQKDGPNPEEILTISNIGGGTLNWGITHDCGWMQIYPNNGSSVGELDEVTLSIDIGGLAGGYYNCGLTISDPCAINNPQIIEVTLYIEETLYVSDEGYPTIQSAVDAAPVGAKVIVADGIYTGEGNRDIDFKEKSIKLESENGPDNCIIDCKNQGRGFIFYRVNKYSVLKGLTIINGIADEGGGIYCRYSSPTIRDCVIINSKAEKGGGVCCYGRAQDGAPTIVNCAFKANSTTEDNGGGFYSDYSPAVLKGCIFAENHAIGVGGGLCCRRGIVNISNCIFSGNSAGSNGGGVFVDYPSIIKNCTFAGNESGGRGGGMDNHGSSATVANCLFAYNKAAAEGGGISNRNSSSATFTNCIIWNNQSWKGSEFFNYNNSHPTLSYCDIKGGLTSPGVVSEMNSSVINGGGNIDADPWPSPPPPPPPPPPSPSYSQQNGTSCYPWVDRDYHLLPDSPCIDAGDPNYLASPDETDFDGQPRIIGGRIDIGADEFHGNNTEPIADAGPDQTAYARFDGIAKVTLDGTASHDDDGHLLTYLWEWTIDDEIYYATGITPAIELPTGEHTIKLIVNDRVVDSAPDEVLIAVVEAVEFAMKLTPQSVNPDSRGKGVKAHFVLPTGFAVVDVDVNTRATIEPLGIESDYMNVFVNEDGFIEIKAAFGHKAFCSAIADCGLIGITVTGSLTSGRYFYGTDTIKIISKPFEHLADLAFHWLETNCNKPDWCIGLDINQDSIVNFIDFALYNSYLTETVEEQ